MKLVVNYFERNLRIWSVVFFSLSVVVGLFTGYYPRYKQQSLVGEFVEVDRQYKELSMDQLSYQIRHFSVVADDQVPQSN